MGTEENKAIVRRWFEEAHGRGNLAVADELGSPNYVWHHAGTDDPGLAAFKERVARRKAAPDVHVRHDIVDLVAEGDKVVCRIESSGTRQGKRGWMSSVHIFRLAESRIAEVWSEGSGWKEID